MLRDEKAIIENDLVKSQETIENLNSHILTLEKELKVYKDENIKISKEKCDIHSSLDNSIDHVSILQSKLDNLSRNVSKFNKGKENLDHLIDISRPTFDKNGLGFKKPKVSKV